MQVLVVENPKAPILLPVSLVAQIISRENIIDSTRKLDYLLGEFHWREYKVPLISSSALMGLQQIDRDYQRTVIVWPMKGGKSNEFFAFTSHGASNFMSIDQSTVADTGQYADYPSEYILGNVDLPGRAQGQRAVIPDLPHIAAQLFGRTK